MKTNIRINCDPQGADWVTELTPYTVTIVGRDGEETYALHECGKEVLIDIIKGLVKSEDL